MLDAVGKRYLVESWQSEDGNSWFTRYSDGWIEQGGISTGSATDYFQIDLPTEFSSIKYQVLFTTISEVGTYHIYSVNVKSQTTSSITANSTYYGSGSKSSRYASQFNWMACGY